MKQTLLFATLGLLAAGAGAQEVGQVLSSTPIVQQVAVPRQNCQNTVIQPAPVSGGAGILGAIAGAAIGSQIGSGSGRGVATVLGTVGGAVLGNNIEANAAGYGRVVPQCFTETTMENRTVGYNVTYEYNGRQYTVQMPHDPGPTVHLQVSPVGAAPADGGLPGGAVVVAPPVAAAAYPAPLAVAPPPVVLPPPVVTYGYPAYGYPVYPAAYPVYRPFPIGLSLSFSSGHRHRHRHRHWR